MEKKNLLIVSDSGINEDYRTFLNTIYDAEFFVFRKLKEEKMLNKVNPDLILFTGGADVDPSLYGEDKGSRTFTDSSRDAECQDMFYHYNHVPKLGICRGAQILTVLSGGKLIQHVSGHTSPHYIHLDSYYRDIESSSSQSLLTLIMTSTHHQMMFPFKMNREQYDLIGWAKDFMSNTYLDGSNKEIKLPEKFVEPEIVYYKTTSSLCIQGHPEFRECKKETKDYCLSIIDNILILKNR